MQPDINNHTFTKGIKDSVDISKLGSDTWAFPSQNIRIFNKDGQGYIVTPIRGNTINSGTSAVPVIGGADSTGAAFLVHSGYIVIAATEFNGVIYIASANTDPTHLGQGEIGCYPAPIPLMLNPTAGVTPALSGWATATPNYPYGRFYAPLGNFNPPVVAWDITTNYVVGNIIDYLNVEYICIATTSGAFDPTKWQLLIYDSTKTYHNTLPNKVMYNNHFYQCVVTTTTGTFDPTAWTLISTFNSTLFNFTFLNMTEIEIRPHYDNSVNLYITDYTNPNRVINSGFDITSGALTSTVYTPASFISNLNQVLGVTPIEINSIEIKSAGYHKYGNYFFYLRYMNASLDKTDVVKVSNAVQIYDGDMATLSTVQGGDGVNATSPYSEKKVILHLDISTINTTYTYIDVVYQRFYSDPVTDVQLWETWEITAPFPISDILATGGLLTINGNEDTQAVDTGELLTIRGVENICKTQAQLGNRWWGGNWKRAELHDDSLAEFAKLIKITYDDMSELRYGGSLVNQRGDSAFNTATTGGQYKDYTDTYDYVGYFRGEPYMFMVVFRFSNGEESAAYPMNGVDNFALGYLPTDLNYLHYYDPLNAGFGIPIEANQSGLYRFPNTDNSNPYRGTVEGDAANDTLHLLGVKFDNTAAKAWLGTGSNGSFMEANITGMYYVRAARNPVLKYQGLMMPLSKSWMCEANLGPDGQSAVLFTLGDPPGSPTPYELCYSDPNTGSPLTWVTGQHIGDTGEDTIGVGAVCTSGQPNWGQFYGKFAGEFDDGVDNDSWTVFDSSRAESPTPVYSWWGAGYFINGLTADNILSAGIDTSEAYKELYFPVFRGYMPMLFYTDKGAGIFDENPRWRSYVSRWFYYYNQYAFYSPDALLEQNNVDIPDEEYYFKRVAVTDECGGNGVRWRGTPDTQYGYTDIIPYYLLQEVDTGYSTGPGYVKATEKCNVFNIHDVDPLTFSVENKMIDNAGDGSDTLGKQLSYTTNSKKFWSNRSIRSARYIGVVTGSDGSVTNTGDRNYQSNNYRLTVTNMYNQYPERAKGFKMSTVYSSIYTTPMYKISDHIKMYDESGTLILADTYTCWKGDCFLQRFYFKQNVWDCTPFTGGGSTAVGCSYAGSGNIWDNPGSDVDKLDIRRYANGLIIGIVIEMKHDGDMRFDQSGGATYFPKVNGDWAIQPNNNGAGNEAFLMNTGNERILDQLPNFAYDPTIPHAKNLHLTRIRFSDVHDQYSIIDGYRNLMPASYKDYDSSFQQIMKILAFDDELVSVQEDTVNRHFTIEIDLTADIPSSTIALGSGAVLSDKIKRIGNFGTQHQYSVKKTNNGIYGVDAFRRLIWSAEMTTTVTGSYVMGGQELNRAKQVEKWVYDWFTKTQPITDIESRLPDTPLLGKGISTGFDAKYKDVIFSFFNYNTGVGKFTIQGITRFNMRWQVSTTYYIWQPVYNQFDQLWYYCKGGTDVGHQPNFYPQYWKLIDFSNVQDFTIGNTYTIGQVVRCCSLATTPCGQGYLVIVTKNGVAPAQSTCNYYNPDPFGVFPSYNSISINCCENNSTALVFNEDLAEFIDTVTYPSVISVNNYRDYFTTGNSWLTLNSYMFRHDMPDYLWFYGGADEMQVSWYENGNTPRGDMAIYTKSFGSQDIHSSEQELYKVEYETEYQKGGHFPYINPNEIWRMAEYLEHHWRLPIMVQQSADKQDFNTQSSMQGTWLKTTLTYNKNVEMFIKNITTSFRISRA